MYIGGFGLFLLAWLLISPKSEVDETCDTLWFFARLIMLIAAPFVAVAAATAVFWAMLPESHGREATRLFIALALGVVSTLCLFGLRMSRQEKKEELAKEERARQIAAIPPKPLTASERGVRALAELKAEKAAAAKLQ
jgi:cytochrome bd-type quinol oxidase subunit 2